jgi:pimeloyl-ACP methyl ester carboxylesterase
MAAHETIATPTFTAAEANVYVHYGLEHAARDVRVPDLDLVVRAVGVGAAGEPVLFMHGIALCSAHAAPLITDSLRWIAVDMPGHGGSSAVDFTNVDLRSWHTTVIVRLLDELQLDTTLRMLANRGLGPVILASPAPMFAYRPHVAAPTAGAGGRSDRGPLG